MNTSSSESNREPPGSGLQPAILLIGPTGSGKSPLGDHLERAGFNGKPCFHFDFGSSLRRVARGEDGVTGLTDTDIEFVSTLLKGGALLEKEKFYIAERIMRYFALQTKIGIGHYLVLNGLPRHVEQAKDVDSMADVKYLINLHCTPEVVIKRIRMNTGGDRMGRIDDSPEEIQRKLQLFQNRTLPLLEHYKSHGTRVQSIDIHVETTPRQIVDGLAI